MTTAFQARLILALHADGKRAASEIRASRDIADAYRERLLAVKRAVEGFHADKQAATKGRKPRKAAR